MTGLGSLLFALVTAMVLDPSLRGDLAEYSAGVLLASVAAMLGLPQALIYFAPNGLVSSATLVRFRRLVVIAVVAATVAGACYLQWSGFALGFVLTLLVVGVGVGLSVETSAAQWLLMGLGRFATVTVARSVSTGLLVIGVLTVLVVRDVSDTTSLVVFVGISISALAVQALIQRRVAAPAIAAMDSGHAFGEFRAYALRSYPGTLLQTCISRLDILVLAAVAPEGQVGIYAVALGLADALMVLPQAVSAALLPDLARRGTEGLSRSALLLGGWLGLQIVATLGFVAVVSVLSPILLSDEYDGIATVAAILAVGNVALGGARIGSSILSGLARPGWASVMAGVVVVIMVPLVLVLGGSDGATGAAVGSAIAYTIGCAVTVPMVIKTVGARRVVDRSL